MRVAVSPTWAVISEPTRSLDREPDGAECSVPAQFWSQGARPTRGSELILVLRSLSPKPMRLLRRKLDKTPVIAALVPEGAPVLAAHEIELVPGPGFPRHARGK
jgi:hypothetical protein